MEYVGNSMDCSKCIVEHNTMLKTQGYGYSYIGNIMDCSRHQTNENKFKQNVNTFRQ